MKISLSLGSDILFHVTSITAAVNILLKNRFELKPVEGSEWEEKLTGGKFYLSTARSMQSAYIRKSLYSYSVVLKLDGRALGQNFKVKAIDYWGSNEGRDGADKLYRRKQSNEMEDRVLANTQFIPKAVKYIAEIHAHVNDKRNLMFRLKKMCLLHKIQLFFYDDQAALGMLNKAKAIDVAFSKEDVTPPKPHEYSKEYIQGRYLRDKRGSSLRKWLELYKIPIRTPDVWDTVKTLNKEHGKKAYDRLRYTDTINGFKADLHNAKTAQYGDISREREYLDEVVGVMRKNKQTPEQFIEALRNKWYPRV